MIFLGFLIESNNRSPMTGESITASNAKFHCPRGCGRKYKQQGSLSKHLKYVCGVAKQFECLICGKKFARKDRFKAHMGLVHKMLIST